MPRFRSTRFAVGRSQTAVASVNGKIRVVIADDDIRMRTGIRELLELETDIEVVATTGDGATAVEMTERLDPDVVLMDVRMPTMNGIEATRLIRTKPHSLVRVLVVTTFDLDDYVLGAVRAGASGFLLKDQAPEQLAEAVRTVAAGDGIVAPRATARLLEELVGRTNPDRAHSTLTPREIDVVMLIAAGMNNEAIAEAAGITRATVKTHVSSILSKLGLTSRIQIVVWAYEQGWVTRS